MLAGPYSNAPVWRAFTVLNCKLTVVIIFALHYSSMSTTFLPSEWVRQLQLQDPYTLHHQYSNLRSLCTWSEPITTRELFYTQKSGDYTLHEIFDHLKTGNVSATVCLHSTKDLTGNLVQQFITRVGPFDLEPGEEKFFFLIPAGPQQSARHQSFLVETYDGVVDVAGNSIPYPPVHPHHSATYMFGNRSKGAWSQVPALPWYHSFDELRDSFLSYNLPGYTADLFCNELVNPAACYYVKFPDGTGIPQYPDLDFVSNSDVNNEGQTTVRGIFLEFGRKWVLPLSSSLYLSLSVMDFAINGDGLFYFLPPSYSSVGWETFVLPAGGRFLKSFYHTHPRHDGSMDELWVLSKHVVLPVRLKNITGTSPLRSSFHGSSRCAIPLEPHGLSIRKVQQHILSSHADALRCRFQSRSLTIDGQHRSQGGVISRDTLQSCNGWRFEAGQELMLFTFNEPSDSSGWYPNHHRWWPLAVLDF